MRTLNNLVLVLVVFSSVLISSTSNAQIKLPKGFDCIKANEFASTHGKFTDGNYTFYLRGWNGDGTGKDAAEQIEEELNHKIKFKKTGDGLYWSTGKIDGKFIYTVITNEPLQYSLTSKLNDVEFSNHSEWMLSEIRRVKKENAESFFTDYLGKSCFGFDN